MFEESVENALGVMLATSGRADAAKAHVDRVEEQLQSARTQAEQKLGEVEAALAALREQAESAKQRAGDAFQEALARVEAFADLVRQEAAELESRIEAMAQEAADVAADAQRFGEESIDLINEFADTVEELKNACAELMEALEGEAEDTVQFFNGDFQAMLDESQQKLSDRSEALQRYIADEVVPGLEDRSQQLADQLQQTADRLREVLQSGQEEVGSGVEASLEQVRDSFENDGVAALGERSDQLASDSQRSGSTLVSIGETAGQAKDTLLDAVETTNVGIEAAVGALREIRLLLEEVAGLGSD
ncbi:MAG: hypothetical protein AMXMBFR81_23400 [Chthonomonas sp.]